MRTRIHMFGHLLMVYANQCLQERETCTAPSESLLDRFPLLSSSADRAPQRGLGQNMAMAGLPNPAKTQCFPTLRAASYSLAYAYRRRRVKINRSKLQHGHGKVPKPCRYTLFPNPAPCIFCFGIRVSASRGQEKQVEIVTWPWEGFQALQIHIVPNPTRLHLTVSHIGVAGSR